MEEEGPVYEDKTAEKYISIIDRIPSTISSLNTDSEFELESSDHDLWVAVCKAYIVLSTLVDRALLSSDVHTKVTLSLLKVESIVNTIEINKTYGYIMAKGSITDLENVEIKHKIRVREVLNFDYVSDEETRVTKTSRRKFKKENFAIDEESDNEPQDDEPVVRKRKFNKKQGTKVTSKRPTEFYDVSEGISIDIKVNKVSSEYESPIIKIIPAEPKIPIVGKEYIGEITSELMKHKNVFIDYNNMLRALSWTNTAISKFCETLYVLGVNVYCFDQMAKLTKVTSILGGNVHDDVNILIATMSKGGVIITADRFSEFNDKLSLCKEHSKVLIRKNEMCVSKNCRIVYPGKATTKIMTLTLIEELDESLQVLALLPLVRNPAQITRKNKKLRIALFKDQIFTYEETAMSDAKQLQTVGITRSLATGALLSFVRLDDGSTPMAVVNSDRMNTLLLVLDNITPQQVTQLHQIISDTARISASNVELKIWGKQVVVDNNIDLLASGREVSVIQNGYRVQYKRASLTEKEIEEPTHQGTCLIMHSKTPETKIGIYYCDGSCGLILLEQNLIDFMVKKAVNVITTNKLGKGLIFRLYSTNSLIDLVVRGKDITQIREIDERDKLQGVAVFKDDTGLAINNMEFITYGASVALIRKYNESKDMAIADLKEVVNEIIFSGVSKRGTLLRTQNIRVVIGKIERSNSYIENIVIFVANLMNAPHIAINYFNEDQIITIKSESDVQNTEASEIFLQALTSAIYDKLDLIISTIMADYFDMILQLKNKSNRLRKPTFLYNATTSIDPEIIGEPIRITVNAPFITMSMLIYKANSALVRLVIFGIPSPTIVHAMCVGIVREGKTASIVINPMLGDIISGIAMEMAFGITEGLSELCNEETMMLLMENMQTIIIIAEMCVAISQVFSNSSALELLKHYMSVMVVGRNWDSVLDNAEAGLLYKNIVVSSFTLESIVDALLVKSGLYSPIYAAMVSTPVLTSVATITKITHILLLRLSSYAENERVTILEYIDTVIPGVLDENIGLNHMFKCAENSTIQEVEKCKSYMAVGLHKQALEIMVKWDYVRSCRVKTKAGKKNKQLNLNIEQVTINKQTGKWLLSNKAVTITQFYNPKLGQFETFETMQKKGGVFELRPNETDVLFIVNNTWIDNNRSRMDLDSIRLNVKVGRTLSADDISPEQFIAMVSELVNANESVTIVANDKMGSLLTESIVTGKKIRLPRTHKIYILDNLLYKKLRRMVILSDFIDTETKETATKLLQRDIEELKLNEDKTGGGGSNRNTQGPSGDPSDDPVDNSGPAKRNRPKVSKLAKIVRKCIMVMITIFSAGLVAYAIKYRSVVSTIKWVFGIGASLVFYVKFISKGRINKKNN